MEEGPLYYLLVLVVSTIIVASVYGLFMVYNWLMQIHPLWVIVVIPIYIVVVTIVFMLGIVATQVDG